MTKIVRNEGGEVVGFTLLHSQGSNGPTAQEINLLDENDKYAKKYFVGKAKYYAWDTPDADEPGRSNQKIRPSWLLPFGVKVQAILDGKTKEEALEDFWILQSLRMNYLWNTWKRRN